MGREGAVNSNTGQSGCLDFSRQFIIALETTLIMVLFLQVLGP